MFFIKVTDAANGHEMLIRGDLIFKIEEWESGSPIRQIRRITFVDGESEYVTDTMDELIDTLAGEEDD